MNARNVVLCLLLLSLAGCGGGDTTADAARDPDAASSADAPTVYDTEPIFMSDAGPDAPAAPVYAGLVADRSSDWRDSFDMVGLEAGTRQCVAIGADHPCDYDEIVVAAARGELDAVPVTTTAWLQRTTRVTMAGTTYEPGEGANCSSWTFTGNHLADGEYVTFEVAGDPIFHLDPDPVFDPGSPNVHTTPGDLECGGVTRALLCCNAR